MRRRLMPLVVTTVLPWAFKKFQERRQQQQYRKGQTGDNR